MMTHIMHYDGLCNYDVAACDMCKFFVGLRVGEPFGECPNCNFGVRLRRGTIIYHEVDDNPCPGTGYAVESVLRTSLGDKS
jgi:hypothetical protein